MDQHLCGGLAGSVWVGGSQDAGLQQIVVVISDLAIDLVGGDVDELLDAHLLGTLEENVRAVHVGVGELVGVSEAQVDVGLGGKVEDGIDVMPLEAVHDLGGVGDVAMVEGEIPLVVEHPGIVQRRTVVELVEGHDIVGIGVG